MATNTYTYQPSQQPTWDLQPPKMQPVQWGGSYAPPSYGTGGRTATGPGGTVPPPSWSNPQNRPSAFSPPTGYANTTDFWGASKNNAAMQGWLPMAQLQQNAFQYNQDFGEAQRRWDSEQGWQRASDTYSQQLANRQQQMAEWQAREAANQWGAQFGWQQANDQFSQGLANRQQDWTQQYQGGLLGNQQFENQTMRDYYTGQNTNRSQEIAYTNAYQQGLLGNQRTEAANTAAYQQGLLGNQRTEAANTAAYQQGLLGNQRTENANTAAYQQGLIRNQQQANNIDQAYKQGLISVEQRNLALAELTQQQLMQWRGEQNAIAREQMGSHERMAAMQAYGRAQPRNARYISRW